MHSYPVCTFVLRLIGILVFGYDEMLSMGQPS